MMSKKNKNDGDNIKKMFNEFKSLTDTLYKLGKINFRNSQIILAIDTTIKKLLENGIKFESCKNSTFNLKRPIIQMNLYEILKLYMRLFAEAHSNGNCIDIKLGCNILNMEIKIENYLLGKK